MYRGLPKTLIRWTENCLRGYKLPVSGKEYELSINVFILVSQLRVMDGDCLTTFKQREESNLGCEYKMVLVLSATWWPANVSMSSWHLWQWQTLVGISPEFLLYVTKNSWKHLIKYFLSKGESLKARGS